MRLERQNGGNWKGPLWREAINFGPYSVEFFEYIDVDITKV
jgi:hypothetical protein